jgi:hypothetical protein
MARKLNTDEEQLFADALQQEKSTVNDTASDQFILRVREKRDTALRLTPELAAWLSEGPFGPTTS